MIRANSAKVSWDAEKKRWQVRIQVGEEVIKRPAAKRSRETNEQDLRALAVQTARDDGYEVDPATVAIVR